MACYLKAIKFSTCLQFVRPTAACQIGQFRWELGTVSCQVAWNFVGRKTKCSRWTKASRNWWIGQINKNWQATWHCLKGSEMGNNKTEKTS